MRAFYTRCEKRSVWYTKGLAPPHPKKKKNKRYLDSVRAPKNRLKTTFVRVGTVALLNDRAHPSNTVHEYLSVYCCDIQIVYVRVIVIKYCVIKNINLNTFTRYEAHLVEGRVVRTAFCIETTATTL